MRKKIGNAFFSLCCLAMIVVSAVCVAIYNLAEIGRASCRERV